MKISERIRQAADEKESTRPVTIVVKNQKTTKQVPFSDLTKSGRERRVKGRDFTDLTKLMKYVFSAVEGMQGLFEDAGEIETMTGLRAARVRTLVAKYGEYLLAAANKKLKKPKSWPLRVVEWHSAYRTPGMKGEQPFKHSRQPGGYTPAALSISKT